MNRKSFSLLAAAAFVAASAAVPAWAYQINAPGNYQNQIGQTDWTPATAPLWTETSAGSNIWELSLSGLALPAGSYAYKILNTPDEQTPAWETSVQVTPADSWFTPELSGDVALRLDYTTPSAPKWGFSGAWQPRLVGNFQDEAGGAADWDPTNSAFDMTAGNDNTWSKTLTVSTPGNYEVKLTDGIAEDWSNRQFGANGYRDNASSFIFTTDTADQEVMFSFNALHGTFATAGVVATPPTWKFNASGEWHEPNNWITNTGAPNAVDAQAVFGDVNDWPRTIFNDGGDVTIGKLTFNSPNTYNIAGTFDMTMEVSTGSAQINVLQGAHKINLPLTFASDTVIDVASGAQLKISDPVTIGLGVTVTETPGSTVLYESTVTVEPAASITMASSQRMAALSVGDDGTATMAASGGNKVLRTDALSVSSAGGKLDLNDNKIITKMSTGGGAGGNYTGIAALVKEGRGDGTWNGTTGITTSTASAAAGVTTLAVATAGELGKTTFAGQNVSASDTLVMHTFNGDANLSGNVDADDYFIVDSNYNKSGTVFGFARGDLNYDGLINGDDYHLIDTGFNGQFAPAPAVEGVTAVPEPAGLSLAVVGAIAALGQRRRRN